MTPQEAYDELRCYTLGLHDAEFIHQHVVDAWTAQYADERTRPMALSFALLGLCLAVEHRFSGRQVQRVHTRLAASKQAWPALPLPAERGRSGVLEVIGAPPGAAREAAIRAWCAAVWEAYRDSHAAVVQLLRGRRVL